MKYANSYPVTFCVLRLPDELADTAKRLAEGRGQAETINEPIEVAGFFFKLWSYRSKFTTTHDRDMRQVSPMFLAAMPEMVRPPERNLTLGVVGGVTFVVAIGLVWFGVWRFSAGDRKFKLKTRQVLRRHEDGPDEEPDFSGIDS